jgi:hypothetical protein
VHEGDLEGALRLQVSGVERIQTVQGAYGDGSGELFRLLRALQSMIGQNNISAILTLLIRAIKYSQRHCAEEDNLDEYLLTAAESALQSREPDASEILRALRSIIEQNANAVSSGLRSAFVGWNRWIVTTADRRAFLVWFPWDDDLAADRLGRCALMWSCPNYNEWAVVVDVDSKGYRKAGVAFVDSKHSGPESFVVVL